MAVKVGIAISYYRKRARLTQEELGARVGLDQGNISRLEKGLQDTTISRIELIAKALDISVSDLFAYAEGLKQEERRWREVYGELTEEERRAAMHLLDRGQPYRAKKKG